MFQIKKCREIFALISHIVVFEIFQTLPAIKNHWNFSLLFRRRLLSDRPTDYKCKHLFYCFFFFWCDIFLLGYSRIDKKQKLCVLDIVESRSKKICWWSIFLFLNVSTLKLRIFIIILRTDRLRIILSTTNTSKSQIAFTLLSSLDWVHGKNVQLYSCDKEPTIGQKTVIGTWYFD